MTLCKYCGRDGIPEKALFCPWCGEKQVRARKKKEKKTVSVPKPRQLPSGTWFAQMMVQGERVPISAATEAEYYAKAEAAKLGLIEAKKPDNRLVKDLVAEYIKAREKTVSPSTIDGYERKAKNNLQALYKLRIKDLSEKRVQAAIDADKEKYSGKTIWEAWSLIQAATGVRYEGLVFPSKRPKRKPPVYSEAELRALLRELAAYGGQTECAGLLALRLSLRRSEIMGLKWTDITSNSIRVQTARVYDKSHKLVEKSTKNSTSERTILCDKSLLDKLNALPKEGEYVFTESTSGIWKGLDTVCARAGIPHSYLHGLRHTNATVLEYLGIPSVYANRMTGHAKDHIRKTVYTDVMEEGAVLAANKRDNYFNSLITNEITNESEKSADSAPDSD